MNNHNMPSSMGTPNPNYRKQNARVNLTRCLLSYPKIFGHSKKPSFRASITLHSQTHCLFIVMNMSTPNSTNNLGWWIDMWIISLNEELQTTNILFLSFTME